MTIRQIETIPIRVPLGRVYRGSGYQMTHRATIVTRVQTDEGVVGEAYAGDEDAALAAIDRIIRHEIAPALAGEDALAVERCWALARPATFDILRERRLGLVACACVDTAIWDAVGKALGQPLWRLWGGYRRSLPMIAIGGYYGTGVPIAAEVAELRALELAGLKLKGRRAFVIGSSAGKTGGGTAAAAYAASKAGLMTFANPVAREYAAHDVVANAVSPALIDTEMIRGIPDLRDRIPLGRYGTAQEVADVTAFLCSAHASFITGENVDVNGGLVID